MKHIIDYGSRAGGGMQIPVADLDRDGDLDFVVAGKGGIFLFQNLTRRRQCNHPNQAKYSSGGPMAEAEETAESLLTIDVRVAVVLLRGAWEQRYAEPSTTDLLLRTQLCSAITTFRTFEPACAWFPNVREMFLFFLEI